MARQQYEIYDIKRRLRNYLRELGGLNHDILGSPKHYHDTVKHLEALSDEGHLEVTTEGRELHFKLATDPKGTTYRLDEVQPINESRSVRDLVELYLKASKVKEDELLNKLYGRTHSIGTLISVIETELEQHGEVQNYRTVSNLRGRPIELEAIDGDGVSISFSLVEFREDREGNRVRVERPFKETDYGRTSGHIEVTVHLMIGHSKFMRKQLKMIPSLKYTEQAIVTLSDGEVYGRLHELVQLLVGASKLHKGNTEDLTSTTGLTGLYLQNYLMRRYEEDIMSVIVKEGKKELKGEQRYNDVLNYRNELKEYIQVEQLTQSRIGRTIALDDRKTQVGAYVRNFRREILEKYETEGTTGVTAVELQLIPRIKGYEAEQDRLEFYYEVIEVLHGESLNRPKLRLMKTITQEEMAEYLGQVLIQDTDEVSERRDRLTKLLGETDILSDYTEE